MLGQARFNIFVGDVDSGIECTLSKFAHITTLCCAVIMLEGKDAIQRDFDRFERWACTNRKTFNKARCKVLHLGWGNPKHKHRLGGEWIENSPDEMNLEVLVDEKLNMSWQRVLTDQKSNCILGCIKRRMTSTSSEVILPLFSCETPPRVLCSALGSPE